MTDLTSLRRAAGLTQADVAGRMGIGQSRVSRIERQSLASTELGTIAAYVQAVGGDVTVTAVIGGQPHTLVGEGQ